MIIDLQELLYPDPWVRDYDKRTFKEHPITKIKKVFRLIRDNTDDKTWFSVRKFIDDHPVRRYEKYIALWEAMT